MSTLVEESETELNTHGEGKGNEGNTLAGEQEGCKEEAGLGGEVTTSPKTRTQGLWRTAAARTIINKNQVQDGSKSSSGWAKVRKVSRTMHQNQSSVNSGEEDSYHQVWRPKKRPHLADLVASLGSSQERQMLNRGTTPPLLSHTVSKTPLRLRQQMLQDRIQVTQAVLSDEIMSDERAKRPKMSFKDASERIAGNLQKQQQEKGGCKTLADVVSLYLEKMRAEGEANNVTSASSGVGKSYQTHHGKARLHKRHNTHGTFGRGMPGAIPLEKWHKLLMDSKTSHSSFDGGYKLETEV